MYMHTQLAQHKNIFQRTWLALRYIFGYRCKYGHWEEAVFSEEQIILLAEKIKDFRQQIAQN